MCLPSELGTLRRRRHAQRHAAAPPSMRAAAAGASATACAVHCLARTRARHGERRAHELRRAEPAAAEPGGADESLVRCRCHTQPTECSDALGSPTSVAVPVAACKCARTRGGSSPRNRRRCWPRSRVRRAASVDTCDHGCGTAWLAPHRGSCPRAARTFWLGFGFGLASASPHRSPNPAEPTPPQPPAQAQAPAPAQAQARRRTTRRCSGRQGASTTVTPKLRRAMASRRPQPPPSRRRRPSRRPTSQ